MAIPKDIYARAKKLRDAINRHRYLYHVLDKEELSQSALDALKHELALLEEKYPELVAPDSPTRRVAGAPLPGFKKVKHEVPQWSFNDAFSPEEIREFDERVRRNLRNRQGKDVRPTYSVELKIDGLKIVFTYTKGTLAVAATRGDGRVGEDVTQNIRMIESVPLRLEKDIDIIVEGEVWMAESELARINAERKKKGEQLFANPRNAAAGSIRQLDSKIAAERHLDSYIYDIAKIENGFPSSQTEELALLEKLGFKVNKHRKLCTTIEEVIAFWKKWQTRKKKEGYWIDGVVVKVNEREYQEALGYTGKGPRYAIAFKFPGEQVTTILNEIVWQIGRTGVVTPVAHLEPVAIGGSIVSRATLHNEDEIKRLDVRIGDTVILEKAGDVIPDIVGVVKELRPFRSQPFTMPKSIPECGGDGRIKRVPGEAAWRCVSTESFIRHSRALAYFAGKNAFDIRGLGPKIVTKLMEAKIVADRDDFWSITKGDLLQLPGFKEKAAENILKSIEAARTVELPRFLTGLSVPHVGEETAIDIASAFGTLERIRAATRDDFGRVSGVGPVVAESLSHWFADRANTDSLDRLLKYARVLRYKAPKAATKLSGKSVVVTGVLEAMSRDSAEAAVRRAGGSVSSSVSKKTDYIVVGESPGSKVDKAREFGVKIISEKEFLQLLS